MGKITNPMVNLQIPVGKDCQSNGKPSDSQKKRLKIRWKTIRFLHKKVSNPMVNYQIPLGKDWKSHGKPLDFKPFDVGI